MSATRGLKQGCLRRLPHADALRRDSMYLGCWFESVKSCQAGVFAVR